MSTVDSGTGLLGLFGHPVEHSISPLIHNQALKKHNLNFVYLAFDIKPEAVQSAVAGIRSFGIKGVNVTIPHKKKVVEYLDIVEDTAQKLKAVNTIVNDEGCLKGYNTDIAGFQRMLEKDGQFIIKGKKVLIIGAGGAARAVCSALCEKDAAELYIINQTPEKALRVVEKWSATYPEIEFGGGGLTEEFYGPLLEKVDLVVDTTPVGMEPNVEQPPVIKTGNIHSGQLVVDLVYNPRETTILQEASKKGARTLNGLPMLLYQAAESFHLWTGVYPDVEGWYDLLKKQSDLY